MYMFELRVYFFFLIEKRAHTEVWAEYKQ